MDRLDGVDVTASEQSLLQFAEQVAKFPVLLKTTPPGVTSAAKSVEAAVQLVSRVIEPPMTPAGLRTQLRRFKKHYYRKSLELPMSGPVPEWMSIVEEPLEGGSGDAARAARVLRQLTAQAHAKRTLDAAAVCGDDDRLLTHAWRRAIRFVRHKYTALAEARCITSLEPAARLSTSDWRLLDAILLYDPSFSVLNERELESPESLRELTELLQLVQEYNLEGGGSWRAAVQAWRRLTRAASEVLLRRRWHELKVRARGGRRKPPATDLGRALLASISHRYPGPEPSWRELVQRTNTTDLWQESGSDSEPPPLLPPPPEPAADDDLILVEREIETIDLLNDTPATQTKAQPKKCESEEITREALVERRKRAARQLQRELRLQLRMMDGRTDAGSDSESDDEVVAKRVKCEDLRVGERETGVPIGIPGSPSCDDEVSAPRVKTEPALEPEGSAASEDRETDDVPRIDPKLLMTAVIRLERCDAHWKLQTNTHALEEMTPKISNVQELDTFNISDDESEKYNYIKTFIFDDNEETNDNKDNSDDNINEALIIDEDLVNSEARIKQEVVIDNIDESNEDGAMHEEVQIDDDDDRETSPRRKKVQLPDIDEVRRINQSMQIAQVAPRTQPDTRDPHTDDEDRLVMDERADRSYSPDIRLVGYNTKRSRSVGYCCVARRHRAINSARRRVASRAGRCPPHQLDIHRMCCVQKRAKCPCCCAHLLLPPRSVPRARKLAHEALRLQRCFTRALHAKEGSEVDLHPSSSSSDSDTPLAQLAADKKNKKKKKKKKSGPKPRTSGNTSRRKKRPRSLQELTETARGPEDDPLKEWIRQKNLTNRFFDLNLKRDTRPVVKPPAPITPADVLLRFPLAPYENPAAAEIRRTAAAARKARATRVAPVKTPVVNPSNSNPSASVLTSSVPVGTPSASVLTPSIPVGTPSAPVLPPSAPVLTSSVPVGTPSAPSTPSDQVEAPSAPAAVGPNTLTLQVAPICLSQPTAIPNPASFMRLVPGSSLLLPSGVMTFPVTSLVPVTPTSTPMTNIKVTSGPNNSLLCNQVNNITGGTNNSLLAGQQVVNRVVNVTSAPGHNLILAGNQVANSAANTSVANRVVNVTSAPGHNLVLAGNQVANSAANTSAANNMIKVTVGANNKSLLATNQVANSVAKVTNSENNSVASPSHVVARIRVKLVDNNKPPANPVANSLLASPATSSAPMVKFRVKSAYNGPVVTGQAVNKSLLKQNVCQVATDSNPVVAPVLANAESIDRSSSESPELIIPDCGEVVDLCDSDDEEPPQPPLEPPSAGPGEHPACPATQPLHTEESTGTHRPDQRIDGHIGRPASNIRPSKIQSGTSLLRPILTHGTMQMNTVKEQNTVVCSPSNVRQQLTSSDIEATSNGQSKPSNTLPQLNSDQPTPSNDQYKPSNVQPKPSNVQPKPSNFPYKPINILPKPDNITKPINIPPKSRTNKSIQSNKQSQPSNKQPKPSNLQSKPSNFRSEPIKIKPKPEKTIVYNGIKLHPCRIVLTPCDLNDKTKDDVKLSDKYKNSLHPGMATLRPGKAETQPVHVDQGMATIKPLEVFTSNLKSEAFENQSTVQAKVKTENAVTDLLKTTFVRETSHFNPQKSIVRIITHPSTGNSAGTPSNSVLKSSNSVVKASNSVVKSSDSFVKVSNSAVKASNSAVKSSNSVVKASNSAVKASNSVGKASNSVVKSSDSFVKVSNSAVKASNNAVKSSNSVVKASNSAVKSSNSVAKSSNSVVKSSNSFVKVSNNVVKSSNSFVKVSNNVVKSSNSFVKVSNSIVKSSNSAMNATKVRLQTIKASANDVSQTIIIKPTSSLIKLRSLESAIQSVPPKNLNGQQSSPVILNMQASAVSHAAADKDDVKVFKISEKGDLTTFRSNKISSKRLAALTCQGNVAQQTEVFKISEAGDLKAVRRCKMTRKRLAVLQDSEKQQDEPPVRSPEPAPEPPPANMQLVEYRNATGSRVCMLRPSEDGACVGRINVVYRFSSLEMPVAEWARALGTELRVYCLDSSQPYLLAGGRYLAVCSVELFSSSRTYWSRGCALGESVRLVLPSEPRAPVVACPDGLHRLLAREPAVRARVEYVIRSRTELASVLEAGGARVRVVCARTGNSTPLQLLPGGRLVVVLPDAARVFETELREFLPPQPQPRSAPPARAPAGDAPTLRGLLAPGRTLVVQPGGEKDEEGNEGTHYEYGAPGPTVQWHRPQEEPPPSGEGEGDWSQSVMLHNVESLAARETDNKTFMTKHFAMNTGTEE